MQKVKLNNGIEMPLMGFGVFQIPDPSECEKSVITAIEAGYRLIDTATLYQNEKAVGNAIKNSGIAREELFITTKLWIQDTGYQKTKKSFEQSLKKLQVDYLDLYLLHQQLGDYYGSWRAMEELYKEGKIRAIGISNFFPDRAIDLVVHNEITPAVNQIEVNPFYQRKETIEFHQNNNILVQSWASFAEGQKDIFNSKILSSIGAKYNKSIAQVVLRWLIQQNVAVIPKSVTPSRIFENNDIWDFVLSDEDMQAIVVLDTNKSVFFDHREPDTVKWLASLQYEE
ncbi:aldo/keto reductase [Flectobacillus major]|uniref:aldo/keto reductase n=1 Tax=Flectobacillus major TaxID=103 RepID=UPI0003F77504|nr:aldo/keto reductase [Flectobacillus major]